MGRRQEYWSLALAAAVAALVCVMVYFSLRTFQKLKTTSAPARFYPASPLSCSQPWLRNQQIACRRAR